MGKHAKVKYYTLYNGGRLNKEKCPRCNSILAKHKNRKTCGKCGFSEIIKKES